VITWMPSSSDFLNPGAVAAKPIAIAPPIGT
jgi:hypothetical protein